MYYRQHYPLNPVLDCTIDNTTLKTLCWVDIYCILYSNWTIIWNLRILKRVNRLFSVNNITVDVTDWIDLYIKGTVNTISNLPTFIEWHVRFTFIEWHVRFTFIEWHVRFTFIEWHLRFTFIEWHVRFTFIEWHARFTFIESHVRFTL